MNYNKNILTFGKIFLAIAIILALNSFSAAIALDEEDSFGLRNENIQDKIIEKKIKENVTNKYDKENIINQKTNQNIENKINEKSINNENKVIKEQVIKEEKVIKSESKSNKAKINENIDLADQKEINKNLKKETTKNGNIYPWLPSMINLYKGQVEQKTVDLKTFGSEIFENSSNLLTSLNNISVGDDYIVGPDDSLNINIWGAINTNLTTKVDREGKIVLPEVGTFYVTGKSFGSLKNQLRSKLNEIFNNVSVDVSLGKLRSIKVYVVGEAKKTGAYNISSISSLFNVIFKAGGPSPIGSMRNIDIIRNNKVIRNIDLYDFLVNGDKSSDIRLKNGDSIYFNLKGETIGIQGVVTRPAIYELKKEKALDDAIKLAGGLMPTSYLKKIQVKRVIKNTEVNVLNIDISSKEKIRSFKIQDKDIIKIFPILTVDKQSIYLNGHVFRPGTYQYKNGMKLSDILKSYNDVLPEPYLSYAQLIRLQPPNMEPYNYRFNLKDVLEKKEDLELKVFDTIIVYSKWSFTRTPEVEIIGEIFKPGKYKLINGMKIIDLVNKAEGFTKETYINRAEIIRTIDEYNNKKKFSIDLKSAMKGSIYENIPLKDRDIVIVHNNKDIFDTKMVSISGQVTKPNSYVLGKGMRVKDLVTLSGNLNKSAYKKNAEIVRFNIEDEKIDKEVISINLDKALKENPKHNILLQDMDNLIIKQIPNWYELSRKDVVKVQGEVLNPGEYRLSGMRVSDAILKSGGLTLFAYNQRAEIIRNEDDYENKTILTIDIEKALNGDSNNNLILKNRDILIIHNKNNFINNRFVEISGSINKPDKYPLGKLMRLKDLINLSGSLKKTAYYGETEITRFTIDGNDTYSSVKTINLRKAMEGDPNHNIVLKDMDRIVIKQVPNLDYLKSNIVIYGEINHPGTYPIRKGDKISDLIKRAGGFTNEAYLKGAKYYREAVKKIQKERLDELVSDLESSIALDKAESLDEARSLSSTQAAIRLSSLKAREKLLQNLKKSSVSGRLIIKLNEMNKFTNSDSDISIENNDSLYIPKASNFVSIIGEVYTNNGILYKKGKDLSYYIDKTGGTTPDADKNRIYIIRSDGSIVSSDGKWFYNIYHEKIYSGDTILIPQYVNKTDYMETVRSVVDIAYKSAIAAGVLLNSQAFRGVGN